jgi:hypothetical protein
LLFLTGNVVFAVGGYAIYLGHQAASATIITGSAASVRVAYYFRSHKKGGT